jgi:PncC family amidohydrolase
MEYATVDMARWPGLVPVHRDWICGYARDYASLRKVIHNVKSGTLIAHGAVSEHTAQEMALGARALLKCDIAVSVTGIAGPGGGTDEKPVGLTYIAVAGRDDLLTWQRNIWEGDREAVKRASADAALRLVLDSLAQ